MNDKDKTMKELFEKYKISHLNTSDGKVFMIHENALQDIAKEYITEQLRIHDVVGQSEQLPCDKCENGLIWSKDRLKGKSCDCGK